MPPRSSLPAERRDAFNDTKHRQIAVAWFETNAKALESLHGRNYLLCRADQVDDW